MVGKTLTFALPAIQQLKEQEDGGYIRLRSRPRCLILVPTRDLARQVLSTVKKLSHHVKISSGAVLGGEDSVQQKEMLAGNVDIVVASPGRLLLHKDSGNVHLGHVTHVIIDEVDTMLTQGFGRDIRAILQSIVLHPNKVDGSNRTVAAHVEPALPNITVRNTAQISMKDSPISKFQVIMASASITKPVRALVGDMEGFNISFKDQINPSTRMTGTEKSQQSKTTDAQSERINIKVVEVDGFHKALPNVKHVMTELNGKDKMSVLDELLQSRKGKHMRTMIFCNTIDSSRALSHQFEMSTSMDIPAELFASYHGDLKSEEREKNLNNFRSGRCQYLICTDIAARGLDITDVDHVIMFDFPLNPIDYLHRSGRTGRAGRPGRVTALIGKRDRVLAHAIERSISKNLPLDSLSSSKRDYLATGRLASLLGQSRKNHLEVDRYGLKKATARPMRPRRGRVNMPPSHSATKRNVSNSLKKAPKRGSDKDRNDKSAVDRDKKESATNRPLSVKARIKRKRSYARAIAKVHDYNRTLNRPQFK